MAISDRMKRMHNCVGISLTSKEQFAGKLYNCYQEEEIAFAGLDDFFNIVNTFLDTLDFPAQKIKYRCYKKTLPTLKIVDIDPKKKLFDTEHLFELCEDTNYILMVMGRDNATWQGVLYSKEDDKEASFNSEVELLRLFK